MRRMLSCLLGFVFVTGTASAVAALPFGDGVGRPRAFAKPVPGLSGVYRTVPRNRVGAFDPRPLRRFDRRGPIAFDGLPWAYGDIYDRRWPAYGDGPIFAQPPLEPEFERGPVASTGIRPPPIGQPTVYIINADRASKDHVRPRATARDPHRRGVLRAGDPEILQDMSAGPKIVHVSVPRGRRNAHPDIIYAPD